MATKACILIREKPHYRREAFVKGAINAGYKVSKDLEPKAGNILVIWNRYGVNHTHASNYEKAGGKVYVVENSYMGNCFLGGCYSISLNRHNVGQVIRERKWKWGLDPYRSGSEVILLPQRGIGQEGVKMPRDWLDRTEKLLRSWGVDYRVRTHPGTRTDAVQLQDDLLRAKCVITWGSGAALKAMRWGYPVLSDFPDWIGASASGSICQRDIADPPMLDRGKVFDLIASSLFTLPEIEAGDWLK